MIEAYQHLKRNVPLLVTGTGEDQQALKKLAAGDSQDSLRRAGERPGPPQSVRECAPRRFHFPQQALSCIRS